MTRTGLHLLRTFLKVRLQEENLPEITSQRVTSQAHFQSALFGLQARFGPRPCNGQGGSNTHDKTRGNTACPLPCNGQREATPTEHGAKQNVHGHATGRGKQHTRQNTGQNRMSTAMQRAEGSTTRQICKLEGNSRGTAGKQQANSRQTEENSRDSEGHSRKRAGTGGANIKETTGQQQGEQQAESRETGGTQQ